MTVVAEAASSGHPDDAGLARDWWAVGVRGVLAVVFGVAVLVLPPPTLASMVVTFAVYLAADGVLRSLRPLGQRGGTSAGPC